MVKLIIDEKEEEKEKRLVLKLVKSGKDVILNAETSDGENWCLVTISSAGELYRHLAIPKDIGLKVDADGRL